MAVKRFWQTCLHCRQRYFGIGRLYCCIECRDAARAATKRTQQPQAERTCEQCGEPIPSGTRRRFCDERCRVRAQYRRNVRDEAEAREQARQLGERR